MLIAITREVSPSIGNCELTHLDRIEINVDVARAQHRNYSHCLSNLGCEVIELPAEPDLPDSVFVEDTAVVLDEVAIITRPGAESRRAETPSIAEALAPYRTLEYIEAPGILDGGDVLVIGKTLYIGISSRTDAEGIKQMHDILSYYDYIVEAVDVDECLHLKSALALISPDTLLINRDWVDVDHFSEMKLIDVHPEEPYGANALLIAETVIFPARFPRTRERLDTHGIKSVTIDVSELAKAEGGLTCCSLIFNT
ncbi:MAG: dimethylargininase [Anaerolineales bacterium]|nr:dimethylargininase [Anaerolineales bacterium]